MKAYWYWGNWSGENVGVVKGKEKKKAAGAVNGIEELVLFVPLPCFLKLIKIKIE